jgi:hypothetical protein
VTSCLADFDAYILSFDKTGLLQSLKKGGHYDIRKQTTRTKTRQNTDHPPRFLRAPETPTQPRRREG